VASLMRVWAQMSLRARSILLCTITSGIFLRVFCLETFEFNRDQLDKILDGLAVPGQHWWIECAGTTSVGIPISPCFTYIMAVFTSITSDPYAVTAIFVVLNCIVL